MVPDHAPKAKLSAMRTLEPTVEILACPFAEWFKYVMSEGIDIPPALAGSAPALQQGIFVSPITNPHVITGEL